MVKRIVFILLFTCSLFAAEKTFIREYTYTANRLDTKETSRRIALQEVKTLLLEEVGVYISSELNINTKEILKDGQYEMNESVNQKITSITAGITQTEIVEEKWTKKLIKSKYSMKAKITLDPDDINSKIKEVINKKQLLADLDYSRKQAQDAIQEIKIMNKRLAESDEEIEKLKLEYEQKTNILLAVEMFHKGYNAYINEEWDKAISFYLRCIELVPDNVIVNNNLGLVYRHQGNYSKAIQMWEKAIELDSSLAMAFSNLGMAYIEQGNYSKAIPLIKRSIELDPDEYDVYLGLGLAYYNQGYISKAKNLWEEVLRLDPENDSAYVSLGLYYGNQGQETKALQLTEIAIELNPANSMAHRNIGVFNHQLGNYTEAIQSYEKAILLDPDNFVYYHFIGLSYSKQGNYSKAIEAHQKVIELNPEYSEAYRELGIVYLNLNNKTELISNFKKAARLDNKLTQAWLKKNGYDW